MLLKRQSVCGDEAAQFENNRRGDANAKTKGATETETTQIVLIPHTLAAQRQYEAENAIVPSPLRAAMIKGVAISASSMIARMYLIVVHY